MGDTTQLLCRVGPGRYDAPMAGPVGVEKLAARLVDAFVGVGTEIIALRLEQVGRQSFAAIRIVKPQRGAEGGHGDAFLGSSGDDIAPGSLRIFDRLSEERIEQKI